MQIISGKFKGRVICKKTEARPTTNYTKQLICNLLFNNKIVQKDLTNSIILDGFCGTGAVGFELLSRGAKFVDFIDVNKIEIDKINKLLSNLEIENSTAKVGKFPKPFIEKNYDIIFLDPPYEIIHSTLVKTTKYCLEFLNENGFIILEVKNDVKLENFNIILDYKVNAKTKLLFIIK